MDEFVFNPPYSITGEEGKTYRAARRDLGQIGGESAVLEFASQAEDTLSWVQVFGNPPEYGQEITLWDRDGVRVFCGNVTSVDPVWNAGSVARYNVTVSGPWWWLEKAQLTGLVSDSTGTESERVAFLLPTQKSGVSFASIIERMRGIGVPLDVGSVAETFTIPQMIMQGVSAAVALRDVLGMLPDATTSVSYDVDGLPRLNLHRRGEMPVRTFQLGAEGNTLMEPIALKARRELRPTVVEVQSMRLDAAGEIIYENQVAGDTTGLSGVLGRQLVAVSGPGRSDFRERTIRKVKVRTTAKANIQEAFYIKHQALSELKREIGGVIELYEYMTGSGTITVSNGSGFVTTTFNPKLAYNIDGSATIDAASILDNLVVTEDLPDWWSLILIPRQRVRITARFVSLIATSDPIYASAAALATFTHPISGGTAFFADLDIELDAISTAYAVDTIVVHPLDKALVQPVENLAANLFAAQDWVPYDGRLNLSPGGSVPLPSRSINIRGGFSDWDYMRALQSSSSINLSTGKAQITLGAPARQPASTLMERFQRSTRGNVIGL